MAMRASMMTVVAAMVLLAGCDDINGFFAPQPEVTPVATEPDIVSVKLAQAADKASRALDQIANIEQQKNPAVPPVQDDTSNVAPNLMQPVSVRWSGPIEQIGRTLAERAGMRFRVKGNEPAAPLVVTVDAYQEPIIQILRNIGLQAGTRATLAIDSDNGVVEVRYAAADYSH